ncbi:MAG: phosphotransferase [Myxococcaceae bacterium]
MLKTTSADEPLDAWRARVEILRAAASAGLAPTFVKADESGRTVITEYVAPHPLFPRLAAPATRAATLTQLGATVRRLHALPIPPDATTRDAHAFLAETWASLSDFPVPAWAIDTVRAVLDHPLPPSDQSPVLSHNDLNPTNLLDAGDRVLFVDWDSAGPNEPLHDLATLSLFFRLDDADTAHLLSAYDGAPLTTLPERFLRVRQRIAALCGVLFLQLARRGGHPGALEAVLTGPPDARTPEGQFRYGLTLINAASTTSRRPSRGRSSLLP